MLNHVHDTEHKEWKDTDGVTWCVSPCRLSGRQTLFCVFVFSIYLDYIMDLLIATTV